MTEADAPRRRAAGTATPEQLLDFALAAVVAVQRATDALSQRRALELAVGATKAWHEAKATKALSRRKPWVLAR